MHIRTLVLPSRNRPPVIRPPQCGHSVTGIRTPFCFILSLSSPIQHMEASRFSTFPLCICFFCAAPFKESTIHALAYSCFYSVGQSSAGNWSATIWTRFYRHKNPFVLFFVTSFAYAKLVTNSSTLLTSTLSHPFHHLGSASLRSNSGRSLVMKYSV
jgi:hypothetical protein